MAGFTRRWVALGTSLAAALSAISWVWAAGIPAFPRSTRPAPRSVAAGAERALTTAPTVAAPDGGLVSADDVLTLADGISPATGPATTNPASTMPATEPLPGPEGLTLQEVVVHGRSENLLGVADTSNQGYVGQQQLSERPLLRPAEVLEAVPGLVITQHSGPGKANQYFLRGFQLDHGTDFAVTLAGVPQNLPSHAHGQGYLDLNYMIPELIDDIRYRKGPYFADVGDFSAAGSADIQYVNTLPQGIALLTLGSFAYSRGLIADSVPLGKGNLLYAFEYEYEDGPWVAPDNYQKLNGVLRYSAGNAADGFTLTSFAYHGQWTATNQVAQRAISEGLISTFGSLNPTDGGNSQRYTVVGEAHEKDQHSEASAVFFATWYDMDLFNDFTYDYYDPVHGDQFEQQDRRFISGFRAHYTVDTPFFGLDSTSTIGLQVRNDDINNSLHHTEDRRRMGLIRADDILETSCGLYLENRTQWLPQFRTEAGLRGDYYNFVDASNNPANSGNMSAGIFSPKANLIFGPWEKTEFYLSAGYGFHSNDARGINTTEVPASTFGSSLIPTERVTPLVRATGSEVGVRTNIIPHLQSTVSLWILDLQSEEIFNGDTAVTVPSGPTRRYGIELSNYYSPTPWLDFDGDYALSRARFRDFEPAGEYVPESIVSVLDTGITVHGIPEFRRAFGSIRLRYFGPRPLTQDGSVNSNSSTLVNAQVGYHIKPNLTVKLDFLNLFNAKTNDIAYYYSSRLPGEPAAGVNDIHLHPAEPFEVRVTLEARF